MAKALDWIEIGRNFWNLRGSFTFALGMIDIGTHCSLIKLNTGKFLLIDTIAFSDKALREFNELTSNGTLVDAVIATHPFHTMYFPPFFKLYPDLKYYGTPRHLKRGGGVNWAGNIMDHLSDWEENGVHMRIPDGAEFVEPAESNHFSSVHVFHAESRTIHVDDTICVFEHPGFLLRCAGAHHGDMKFWVNAFKEGLKPTEDAAAQFRTWTQKMINDWDFDNIVSAHTGNQIGGAKAKLQQTLTAAEGQLQKHAQKHLGKKDRV
jgi:hypothetical protein